SRRTAFRAFVLSWPTITGCGSSTSAANTAGGGSVPSLEVDSMLQRLAAQQAPVIIHEHRSDVLGDAEGRGMRRDQKVRRLPKHVGARQRLFFEDIEHRPGEPAFAQYFGQSDLVHDAAASGIHEDRARRQCL